MTTSTQRGNIISIVTPSLNQGEFIEETIRSVLSQEGEFYIDYIINDGGSSDESVRIIRKYEDLLRQNCDIAEESELCFYVPRQADFEWNRCRGVSYRWDSQRDQGQSDAINKGLRAAKGSVAGYINSDDVYCPAAFQKIARLDWSGADFVYGKGIWMSKTGEDLVDYPTFPPTRYSMYYQCTLCQPAVFFAKEAFDRLGDFSLRYSCAFDYEYWLRALFRNCTFKYLAETLARSRMHPANKSLSSRSRNLAEVSELKKIYFTGQSARLNTFRLWSNFFTVQLPTHHRVSRLRRLLARQQESPAGA